MSWRYFLVSRCIEQSLGAFDALTEIGIADRGGGDQIRGPAEELLQSLLETEEGIDVGAGLQRFELDQEIEIAARRIEIVARCRAEHIEPPYMEAAAQVLQFLAMVCNVRDHRPLHTADEYSRTR